MSKAAAALKTPTYRASVPTHMVAIADLYLASEAPKGTNLQVRDSGRGSPLTDEELKASIYHNGIIHPLIWKEYAGKKYVVAGNRRLRFLREIFADALDTQVRTEDVADYPGDWRAVAMDTNLALPPHLVERYEMIVLLAKDQKLSEREVCARFGMSDIQYRRVMALGKMAPVVREAWKAGTISAKTAQTFTVQPDPKEQEAIYNSLLKQGRVDDWSVRRRIVPASQAHDAAQKIAFVGLEVAKKAGVLKQEDLFSGENHVVGDMAALNKLVGDKMAKACEELTKAGWSWAIPKSKLTGQEYEYGDVHPDKKKAIATPAEKARIAEIDRLINDSNEDEEIDFEALEDERDAIESTIANRGFSDEQRKRAGCILRIGHQGELQITYGKVKPAERKKVESAERRATAPAKPKKPNKPGEVALTNALAERLSQQFERGLAEAMEASPYVAIAAMIAGFASFGEVVSVDVGKRQHSARNANDKNFLQVFQGALASSPQQQAVMLAKIAAEALDLHAHAEQHMPAKKATVQALARALPKDVVNAKLRAYFDLEGYFDSVDLKTCIEAVRCTLGEGQAAAAAKMKKKDAAKFAAKALKPTLYMPPAMRTEHYTGPVEAKPAKKAKAKPPAKKAKKAKGKK